MPRRRKASRDGAVVLAIIQNGIGFEDRVAPVDETGVAGLQLHGFHYEFHGK